MPLLLLPLALPPVAAVGRQEVPDGTSSLYQTGIQNAERSMRLLGYALDTEIYKGAYHQPGHAYTHPHKHTLFILQSDKNEDYQKKEREK